MNTDPQQHADTVAMTEPPLVYGQDHWIHYVYIADGLWTGCGLNASWMPPVWGGETNRCEACVKYERQLGDKYDGTIDGSLERSEAK